MNKEKNTKIALFQGKKVRKTINNNEWWFSVIDVVEILTETDRPRKYWNDLKKKLEEEGYFEVSEKIGQLKLIANDGKKYLTDCANTEGIFRIIQSIPSPKAEPFKRWLAKVGYERIKEIEDPELATKRTKALYKAKGYPSAWIEKRMRGIAIREELTDEWQNRGVDIKMDNFLELNEGGKQLKNGYITLISVIIVGSVGLSIAVSLILLGVGSTRTSFALEQSVQAKALANACAEDALERIRKNNAFAGTHNLTLGQGDCGYEIQNTGGENRTIRASSTVGTIVRKVKVIIDQISPKINVSSWQEIASF